MRFLAESEWATVYLSHENGATGKSGTARRAERHVEGHIEQECEKSVAGWFHPPRENRPAGGHFEDVPGQPRVVFTPGHSDGHCAIHFERHGVVFAGDSLCTRNPLTGRVGAQLMPSAFNTSTERAMESLDALEAIAAETVLPGHGDPWTDGAAKAAQAARRFGPT